MVYMGTPVSNGEVHTSIPSQCAITMNNCIRYQYTCGSMGQLTIIPTPLKLLVPIERLLSLKFANRLLG